MKFNIKSHYVYLAAIVIVGAIGINLHNQDANNNQYSDITLANINALMQSEDDSEKGNSDPEKGSSDPEKGNSDPEKGGLDTNYTRNAKNCEFYVGANVEVKVGRLGTVKAGADGIISVPEQVTCLAGGNETCRPVECIEILALIF